MKKTIWLTYSWDDNKERDVDFIAQELEEVGLKVKLDRWNISAGKRLWEQIENFILNENECDGWLIYATSNSLRSEPCKEELSYAVDRALNRRNVFPIIGVFHSSVVDEIIPAAIKTRLYVSLTDPDWKERIKSSLEGKEIDVTKKRVAPYALNFHELYEGKKRLNVIEIRPRAGSWTPSFVAVPIEEKQYVDPRYKYGPKGVYDQISTANNSNILKSEDGNWWIMSAHNEVSPVKSIYLICCQMPTKIMFGVINSDIQFEHTF